MSKSFGTRYKETYETIRAALEVEASRRAKRTFEAWILAERECVLREVNHHRHLQGHTPVKIAEIERAERLALGHSDYIAKYAHAAADLVFKEGV